MIEGKSLTATMKQALEALEQVTKELLAVRDELAERGARPTTNVFHQRLWDSSFSAYTDHAIPAAQSLRQAIAELESQEPIKWSDYEPNGMHHNKPAKPIPCANHCEATAFEIVIKNLQGEIERLKASQRTWVGLTDEEISAIEDEYIVYQRIPAGSAWDFAKDIEAKLKEKNT